MQFNLRKYSLLQEGFVRTAKTVAGSKIDVKFRNVCSFSQETESNFSLVWNFLCWS